MADYVPPSVASTDRAGLPRGAAAPGSGAVGGHDGRPIAEARDEVVRLVDRALMRQLRSAKLPVRNSSPSIEKSPSCPISEVTGKNGPTNSRRLATPSSVAECQNAMFADRSCPSSIVQPWAVKRKREGRGVAVLSNGSVERMVVVVEDGSAMASVRGGPSFVRARTAYVCPLLLVSTVRTVLPGCAMLAGSDKSFAAMLLPVAGSSSHPPLVHRVPVLDRVQPDRATPELTWARSRQGSAVLNSVATPSFDTRSMRRRRE